ncbi:MAG: LacI family DNA-binding transcriptional regulator [Chloroflexi bacterium]|nr:LacI family DNA-binding transcriptional regulator [Chloroflexota bacterium]
MTIINVAELAGLSQQTVSRAMNSRNRISQHTPEHVPQIVDDARGARMAIRHLMDGKCGASAPGNKAIPQMNHADRLQTVGNERSGAGRNG